MAALAGLVLLPAVPAQALIERLTPLEQFIGDADLIFVGKVTRLDAARPTAVLLVAEDLQGKCPWRELPVNLRGSQQRQTDDLLARLADDLPVIVFVTHLPDKELAFAYSSGTWFQLIGHRQGDSVRWSFTHLEIYLPRTFHGSTAELQATLVAAIAGKQKPPPADPQVPAGLGPKVQRPADQPARQE